MPLSTFSFFQGEPSLYFPFYVLTKLFHLIFEHWSLIRCRICQLSLRILLKRGSCKFLIHDV
uniref:Uncharacterized protein n=1 Tax=Rhizophora mucronata TaxID=61149 RepID=A0A2P2J0Q0_RHIMU